MTIYIGRNQVEIRSLAPLVCFVTIWCKQFQGLSPSKRNGRGFTTNSAGVTERRSQVDIFLVVDEMSMQLMVATFNNYQELVDKALMIEGKQQQIESRKRKYGQ